MTGQRQGVIGRYTPHGGAMLNSPSGPVKNAAAFSVPN